MGRQSRLKQEKRSAEQKRSVLGHPGWRWRAAVVLIALAGVFVILRVWPRFGLSDVPSASSPNAAPKLLPRRLLPNGLWEIEGPHYRIWTDLEPALAEQAADHVERFRQGLVPALALPGSDPTVKTVVRVYQSREAFLARRKEIFKVSSGKSSYFRFSPDPKDREIGVPHAPGSRLDPEAVEDLQHECLHEYLRSRIPWPPGWLNEGLAELFESSILAADGEILTKPNRDSLYRLRVNAAHGNAMPLPTLWHTEQDDLVGGNKDAYAAAWGFVWFLHRSKDVTHQAILSAVLRALEPTASEPDNIRRVLGVLEPKTSALEEAFRAFLEEEYVRRKIPPPHAKEGP